MADIAEGPSLTPIGHCSAWIGAALIRRSHAFRCGKVQTFLKSNLLLV